MNHQAACILRENTGTSGIVESARTAVSVLADHELPHLIVAGLVVREHGYPRLKIGVDIVVPDVLEVVEHYLETWDTLPAEKCFTKDD